MYVDGGDAVDVQTMQTPETHPDADRGVFLYASLCALPPYPDHTGYRNR
jgi:hypothetical protein